MSADAYASLSSVLTRALAQAVSGKGKDRHATVRGVTRGFTEQPIMSIGRMSGPGYPIGQAMKKAHEAMELPTERAVTELLGAINYLAAAVLLLEEGVSQ